MGARAAPRRVQHVAPDVDQPAAPRSNRFVIAAGVAAACVPVAVAGARRLIGGWRPAGDDAAVTRFAYDVVTRRTPLLGMPSTLGEGGRPWPHHPGPMLFWALAVPLRVFGSAPAGLMVGVGLVNVAAIVALAMFVRRRSGAIAMLFALAALTSAFFSIGQGALSSVLNPEIAIAPLGLFLVLAWSMADGDLLAVPMTAFVGSFIVQTYLLYAPLVGALTALGVVGLVATRARDRAGARHERTSMRPYVLATIVVVAVCWCTAVFQVLTKLPGASRRFSIASRAIVRRGSDSGARSTW